MKGNIQKHFLSMASIAVLLVVTACGSSSSTDPNANSVNDFTTTTPTVNSTPTRQCTKVMAGVTADMLTEFIQPGQAITNLEPPVTYCLTYGASNKATLRLEFEADAGLFFVQFGYDKTLYASKSGSSLEIIFSDGFGLVGIQGTIGSTMNVKFYNYPTYDQAMQIAIDDLYNHCKKGGDWTVAKCLGYGPPTYWWNDPTYTSSDKTSQARTILNDAAKYSILGQVTY